MKKKNLFIVSILGVILGLSTSIRFNDDINIVKADIVSDKYIYIDLSLTELDNPYLHYINEEDKNINLTLIDNDIYVSESTLPIDIFTNDNYGFEICNDTYKSSWIKGNNNLKEDNYNYLCLDNELNLVGYGYYSTRLDNPGATYETQRVWLINENEDFYNEDNWGNKCVNVASYYYKDKWYMVDMESIVNSNNGREHYYVDIPYELTSLHFYRCSNSVNHNYLIYLDRNINYISYGSCYYAGLDDYLNFTTGTVYEATAPILASVVEAYLTYGKDPSNGAVTETMKAVYNTWFKNKSASDNDLKNQKILDYTGYSANNNSYVGLSKTSSFSVNEKWNTMCSYAGIDPKTGEARGSNLFSFLSGNTLLVIAIGGIIIVIVTIGIIMLLRYKRWKDYR